MKGLIKGDSDLIGFVKGALLCQAISSADVRAWAEHIVTQVPDGQFPPYILDLLDFAPPYPGEIVAMIGFATGWPDDLGSQDALYAITYRRGIKPHDCPVSKKEAEKLLMNNPEVLAKFRETFPWIVVSG